MRMRQLYQPAGVVLARVGTDPGDLEVPDYDFFDSATLRGPAHQWLKRLIERPVIRAALHLASPELAEQVERVPSSDVRLRRLLLAVASYLLRWQRRATPFGMFAGVAVVETGMHAAARFGPADRLTVGADAAWLGAVIDRFEQHPGLLARLTVVANNAAEVRGGRVVIPPRPMADPGPESLVEVSVRHTRPVQAALDAAARPVRFADLALKVGAQFPSVPPSTIEALLTELVGRGILLTGLRPPATVVDALAYLLSRLRAADADQFGELASTMAELTTIHDELAQSARCMSAVAQLSGVADRMRAVCGRAGPVLAAATVVDAQITLPAAVVDEAARAASVLLRLTAQPFGTEPWRDFHVRFRERYGPGALVPVRELVGDSGLGLPAGFLGAPRGRAARSPTDRDAALLALIQQATIDGRTEIELADADIDALAVGDPHEMVPPPRVELAFAVQADSPEAVRRGRYRLWVTGVPRPQSSMAGRFTHLLPGPARALLDASYTTCAGDRAVAQVSFPPRRRHNGNVVAVPPLLPNVISIGENNAVDHLDHAADADARPDVLAVDDLAVTADATQLYLVHAPTSRLVQPWALHALEASVQTPPLARFLTEVATARCAVYGPFDFGIGRTLPHLPRIRHGRSVLAAARWILTTADLPASRESMQAWEKAVHAWRERWHVPGHLTLVQGELRLPLDLDHRLDRALLRTRLDRAGELELREAPGPAEESWIGRPCEFLIPFTAAGTARARATIIAARRPDPVALPGAGDVLHAQMLGHHARYDEILTTHLPRLLADLNGDLLRWWFRRHRDTTRPDTDQYLWLYLRLHDSSAYGSAAARLAGFAADLHAQGLLADLALISYRPHTGRYRATSAAEEVAAADSAAALAQITMAARTGLPAHAITAASMADLAAALAPTPRTGYQWLLDQLPKGNGKRGKLSHRARDAALLPDLDNDDALSRHPGGDATAAAWRVRRVALAAYREHLTADACRDDSPAEVLRTLLHDQYVRSIGVDPEREQITNRLARAVALRHLALIDQASR